MTPIFIINLARSPDRKKAITEQLQGLSLSFEIFNAIDGTKRQLDYFKQYNDNRSQLLKARTLGLGQLGCYASHYLLWKKCISLNQPLIILEDDAIIDNHLFMAFYNQIDVLDSLYGCIRLFNNKQQRYESILVQQLQEISIHLFNRGHMSTTGYYLTPKAAQCFLNHSREWFLTVDIYMDRFWDHGVPCYGIIPEILTHNLALDSDIGCSKIKNNRTVYQKFRRELFTSLEFIRRLYAFKILTYKAIHKKKKNITPPSQP